MVTLLTGRAREELVRAGTRMCAAGLVIGTWGNLSCRIPGEDMVVISPSGMPYGSLRAADMVVLDLQGNILEGERRPSSEYLMHLEIYKERPDVGAVVHTHSIYCSAVAVARVNLPPILEDMVQMVGGEVVVAQYQSPGSIELARAAAQGLGSNNAVLLANHGVVGVGRDMEEALMTCLVLEKAAQVYILSLAVGTPHAIPPEEAIILRQNFINSYGQPKC